MFWRAERLGAACTAETVTDDELVLKTTFKECAQLTGERPDKGRQSNHDDNGGGKVPV